MSLLSIMWPGARVQTSNCQECVGAYNGALWFFHSLPLRVTFLAGQCPSLAPIRITTLGQLQHWPSSRVCWQDESCLWQWSWVWGFLVSPCIDVDFAACLTLVGLLHWQLGRALVGCRKRPTVLTWGSIGFSQLFLECFSMGCIPGLNFWSTELVVIENCYQFLLLFFGWEDFSGSLLRPSGNLTPTCYLHDLLTSPLHPCRVGMISPYSRTWRSERPSSLLRVTQLSEWWGWTEF